MPDRTTATTDGRTAASDPAPTFAAELKRRAAIVLFVVGLAVAALNAALYFFGVDALSNPLVSVASLALLLPLYLDER
ncbi:MULTISPECIES: hypothetical protein [Halorussus]|uniref:hypothetical protein n=1 Tax=Halorussus TaxID=1070314 RepID=UPI00209DDFF6|nr:hypothetical protein [Halorussus vallis]USZ76983.1 hypothetical protein NGM07_06555 [Halorussus vallis]